MPGHIQQAIDKSRDVFIDSFGKLYHSLIKEAQSVLRKDLLSEASTNLLRVLVLTIEQLSVLQGAVPLRRSNELYALLIGVFSDDTMRAQMRQAFCLDGQGMSDDQFAKQWDQMLQKLECRTGTQAVQVDCTRLSGTLTLCGQCPVLSSRAKSGRLVRCFNRQLLRSTLVIDESTVRPPPIV